MKPATRRFMRLMLIEAILIDVLATLIGPDRAYIEHTFDQAVAWFGWAAGHALIGIGWALLILATPIAILLNMAGSPAWRTKHPLPRRRKSSPGDAPGPERR
jgi:hypothetical protein